ncbi:MAG: hypothetical protein H6541_13650 [Lentimicrobiaceae bacterium]|nr:hypothetical protein [Lentimicrobiaceae bacterium]
MKLKIALPNTPALPPTEILIIYTLTIPKATPKNIPTHPLLPRDCIAWLVKSCFSFKRFTSKAIAKAIIANPKESRKEFIPELFRKAGNSSSNVNQYNYWRHDNHPVELWSNKVINKKIDYIHKNPVDAGLVFRAEDYVYGSAADDAGEKGMLTISLLLSNATRCNRTAAEAC